MDMENLFLSYKNEISDIVEKLRNNQISIFCGAGAVADYTKKTWESLFTEDIDLNNKKIDNFYKLAEYYELHMDRSSLESKFTNAFIEVPTSELYSNHIKNILDLPITEFWTTNYDEIIETMIKNETGLTPSVIYNSNNLIKIKENKKYKIFKLNGSITDSKSMVITELDYHKFRNNQQLLLEQLKRELILKSFLFIGYSFADRLVLDCLTDLFQSFKLDKNVHYRILKKDYENPEYQKIEEKYFETIYNIKTIYVNSYEEIDDLINYIYKLYKKKNIFISGSFRNLSPKEEDRANNLCKALVEMLIDEGYNIYSGDGKRLGSYVISNATRKLLKRDVMYFHNKLKIMPYIDHTFKYKSADDEERIKMVNKMLKDCSVSIFLYGQSESGDFSRGVMTEFNISEQKELKVIPVASTGFSAKKIQSLLESENRVPSYLERYSSILKNKNEDVDTIVKTIKEILSEIKRISNP